MISKHDKEVIIKHAKNYGVLKVILFGSSLTKKDSNDIDIGVDGLMPKRFFDFGWELYRDLSKSVDVVDLRDKNRFNEIVIKEGKVLYG
jgi:uncharacterized protein